MSVRVTGSVGRSLGLSSATWCNVSHAGRAVWPWPQNSDYRPTEYRPAGISVDPHSSPTTLREDGVWECGNKEVISRSLRAKAQFTFDTPTVSELVSKGLLSY